MKRYVLKKDLPTFNKGETFIFDGDLRRESDNMLAYSQSELDEFPNILKEWFEEIPEEYKRWRAGIGEYYWCLGSNSTLCKAVEAKYVDDDWRFSIGNYFQTKEETQKARNWLKAFTILRDDTKGFKPNWGEISQTKYRVAYRHYRHINGRLYVDWSAEIQHGTIYFASREDAEASIRKHEREWLTYFGMEGKE